MNNDKKKRLDLLEKYLKSDGHDAKSGLGWVSELETQEKTIFSLLRIAKQDFRDLLELKGITL